MNIVISQHQAEIKLIHNIGNLFWVQSKNLEVLNKHNYKILLEKFNKIVIQKDFEIQSNTSKTKEKLNIFLNLSVLDLVKRKYIFNKSLVDYKMINKSRLEYKSISNFSENDVFSIFSDVIKGDSDMNLEAKEEFDGLIEMTEGESYKENWKIVLKDNVKIGMLLPHKYKDGTNEGTLLYVGLIPEFRSKGFAQEIHSQGLQFLKENKVEKYYGSTMKANKAMLKVFEKNKCELVNEQLFYKVAN